MIAYKATRPDGTDFHTGKILYEVGKTVEHPTSKKMVPDEPSTYLSVSVEKADCTGFQWPCRLFEVKTIGETLSGLDASKNKRACLKLKVVRELPAWEALGPNGEAVVALIETAKTITPEQVKRLRPAWDAARDAAWDAARNAAWDAAGYAARNAAGYAARNAAWDAAGYAALALVVRGLISEEHFNTLYGPWKSVMENE